MCFNWVSFKVKLKPLLTKALTLLYIYIFFFYPFEATVYKIFHSYLTAYLSQYRWDEFKETQTRTSDTLYGIHIMKNIVFETLSISCEGKERLNE